MGRPWVLGSILIVVGGVALFALRGIPADTAEDIFRRPVQLSVYHLSQLEVAARRSWRATGQSPQSLGALLEDVPEAEDFRLDPWGNPYLVFRRDTLLVMSSLGQDSVPGSFDDIIQVSTLDSTWVGNGDLESFIANLPHRR